MSVEVDSSTQSKCTGCVKWFNNKSGYGFITLMDNGDNKGKDIFCHHSSIQAKGDLYKYLVQGEYVEFEIRSIESDNHENQAVNITGIYSGDLMCETRNNNKDIQKVKDGFTQIKKRRPRKEMDTSE